MNERLKRKTIISRVPLSFGYNYYVGKYLEKFYQGLSEKKIFAVKCSSCGKVVVPPRSYCGTCNKQMEEWVELGEEGTLENYTVAYVTVKTGEVKKLPEPEIIGMVRLNGADSLMDVPIRGLTPEELKPGIKLRVVWAKQLKGQATDISHFEPI